MALPVTLTENTTAKATEVMSNLTYLENLITSHISSFKQSIYPVGSIYTNANVATDPATLLGFGTWEVFGSGKVMVGVDAGQTEFASLGQTGGAKTTYIDHVHTGASHVHYVNGNTGGSSTTYYANEGDENRPASVAGHIHSVGIWSDGGGAVATSGMNTNTTPSVLQPYITIYAWKRTS